MMYDMLEYAGKSNLPHSGSWLDLTQIFTHNKFRAGLTLIPLSTDPDACPYLLRPRLHGSGDFVLDGDPSPQKGGGAFRPMFIVAIKMPLGMEVGLSPGDFALDVNPAPSSKRGHSPQFSAHVYCGQTAAWIKMPLGTEAGLSPATLCQMGTQPPPQKGWSPLPNFRPVSIVAKRLDGSRWHLAWRWALVQATLW